MAKIIGGLGTSHIPPIGEAMDKNKMQGAYWDKFKQGIEPAREWMAENKPDICIMVYNDHASHFSLEHVIPFGIGMGEEFRPADEGYGRREVPTCKGYPKLSAHIAESLIFDEFDIVMSNELDLDHGATVPLSILFGQPQEWPCKVIPIYVGVIQYPQPTGNRCYNLGKSIKKAIASFDEDIKIAIIGTGGLSHQLQGPRAGILNQEYDRKWLDDLVVNPIKTKNISHFELLEQAGTEGIEAIMWLVMRGAMDEEVNEVYRFMHSPISNTNYSLIILENKNQGSL